MKKVSVEEETEEDCKRRERIILEAELCKNYHINRVLDGREGIPLRDRFAMTALTGLCNNVRIIKARTDDSEITVIVPEFDLLAEASFKIADAMLEERKK